MASSLFWFSIQWSLRDLFDVILFAVCLLGSDELWVYDHIYLFISMKVIWVLWSLICLITYSLVFLLRYLGFVWPTWSIYLAMGRGALWWVWSYGAWSQWQKGNWHVHIVAIKDKKIDLIINSKFIGSQNTHRKKSYIIWISKRPLYWESKEREEAI